MISVRITVAAADAAADAVAADATADADAQAIFAAATSAIILPPAIITSVGVVMVPRVAMILLFAMVPHVHVCAVIAAIVPMATNSIPIATTNTACPKGSIGPFSKPQFGAAIGASALAGPGTSVNASAVGLPWADVRVNQIGNGCAESGELHLHSLVTLRRRLRSAAAASMCRWWHNPRRRPAPAPLSAAAITRRVKSGPVGTSPSDVFAFIIAAVASTTTTTGTAATSTSTSTSTSTTGVTIFTHGILLKSARVGRKLPDTERWCKNPTRHNSTKFRLDMLDE
jgi:hypothetical protein